MTIVCATLGFTPEKLLAAIRPAPNVEKVMLFTAYSPEGKEKAERAEKEVRVVLRQLGIECQSIVLKSPWDFLEIFESMLKSLADLASHNLVFNLTGGPKSMTVAATMASVLLGIPLLYFPEENERVKQEAIHLPVLKLAYSSFLTESQRRVLREIQRRGGTAKGADVYAALRIRPATLDYHFKKLKKLGVIDVKPMEQDRRHRVVTITDAGRLLLMAEKYSPLGNGDTEGP
ncbi:MAG: DUF6293 family protein [bacterium]